MGLLKNALRKGNILMRLGIMLLFIAGCQGTSKEKSAIQKKRGNKVIITGEVQNPQAKRVRIKKAASLPKDFKSANLDGNNGFKTQLTLSEPSFLRGIHKKKDFNFYAEPGDSIHLSFNTTNFPASLNFSGNRSLENGYLADKARLRDSLQLLSKNAQRKLYQKSPQAFLKGIDSMSTTFKRFLDNYFETSFWDNLTGKKSPSSTFLQYEKANNDFLFYRLKGSYPLIYQRLNRGKKANLPEGYYDYRKDIEFKNAKFLNIPAFKDYAKTFLNIKAREKMQANPGQKRSSRVSVFKDIVEQHFTNDTLKAHTLGEVLLKQIQRKGVNSGMKDVLAYYEKLPYREKVKAQINKIRESWKAIQKGKPAPGFAYPDTSGETVALKDLRGSYVYIDAWATWCGPCIREIPKLKELHEKFKDKNIKFVSISLDKAKDKEKWKQMVDNKNLKGYQLFAKGKAFNAKLANDYMINSIPRFILIDPEGKIVDANAPRPSGNIDNRLKQLLN